LFHILKKEAAGLDEEKELVTLFNIGEINNSLDLKIFLTRMPFRIIIPLEMDGLLLEKFREKDWGETILEADYLLDMQAEQGGQMLFQEHRAIRDKLREGLEKYKNNFKKIGQVPVYDGSYIDVYKKIGK
jgi:hypothetical protein